jgi:hypothetical protein
MRAAVIYLLKELAKVLESRGFLITLKDDHIYFSKGNAERELELLRDMFNEVNLNARVEGQQIYLIDKNIPQDTLDKILWYRARNHEAGGGNGWRMWKYFIKRNHGPKINTFSLETGVARLVKVLSSAGIITICSCSGHRMRSPEIHFCGKHNAIWFEVLFDTIRPQFTFHYDWYIDRTAGIDVPLKARRIEVGWKLEYILEDTNQMADYFLENAEYLSNMKKQLFGKSKNKTRKLVSGMDMDQLYEWMAAKYNAYQSEEMSLSTK